MLFYCSPSTDWFKLLAVFTLNSSWPAYESLSLCALGLFRSDVPFDLNWSASKRRDIYELVLLFLIVIVKTGCSYLTVLILFNGRLFYVEGKCLKISKHAKGRWMEGLKSLKHFIPFVVMSAWVIALNMASVFVSWVLGDSSLGLCPLSCCPLCSPFCQGLSLQLGIESRGWAGLGQTLGFRQPDSFL